MTAGQNAGGFPAGSACDAHWGRICRPAVMKDRLLPRIRARCVRGAFPPRQARPDVPAPHPAACPLPKRLRGLATARRTFHRKVRRPGRGRMTAQNRRMRNLSRAAAPSLMRFGRSLPAMRTVQPLAANAKHTGRSRGVQPTELSRCHILRPTWPGSAMATSNQMPARGSRCVFAKTGRLHFAISMQSS